MMALSAGRQALYDMGFGNRAASASISQSKVSKLPNSRFFKHGGAKKTYAKRTTRGARAYAKKIRDTSLRSIFFNLGVPKGPKRRATYLRDL